MSKNREDFHEILCEMLGSRNVYFQPPESIKLKYPCIVYELNSIWTDKADNAKYLKHKQYKVTVINEDPDDASELAEKLLEMQYSRFETTYVADNLNHYVLTIFF